MPAKLQHSHFPCAPQFNNSQKPVPEDDTTLLSPAKIKCMQKNIGSFSCYGRTIETTIVKSLNALATKQAKATEKTEVLVKHF